MSYPSSIFESAGIDHDIYIIVPKSKNLNIISFYQSLFNRVTSSRTCPAFPEHLFSIPVFTAVPVIQSVVLCVVISESMFIFYQFSSSKLSLSLSVDIKAMQDNTYPVILNHQHNIYQKKPISNCIYFNTFKFTDSVTN